MGIDTLLHGRGAKPYLNTGLTALGTTQATAFPLTSNTRHEFTTVGAGTGAVLPGGSFPTEITIANAGVSALLVYPPLGGTIANGTANAAVSLAAGSSITYWASSPFNWYVTNTAGGGGGGGTPGGTAGQIQYDNAGAFGGFTASGDATINTTTGVVTVTASSGTAFGALAFLNAVPAADEPAYSGVITTSAGSTVTSFGTGTLPAGMLPALSGAVTSSAGSGVTAFGATVLPASNMPALTGAVTTSAGALATSFGTIATLTGLVNTTGGTAAPGAATLSAWNDAAIGATQGEISYRGASVWGALAPGSANTPLQSGGASANPSYNSNLFLPTAGPPGYVPRQIFGITGGTSAYSNSSGSFVSLLSGATGQPGQTLTIPANSLKAGQTLRFTFTGTAGVTTGSPTIIYQILLGGTVVLTAGAASTLATASNAMFFGTYYGGMYINIWSIGSSALVSGYAAIGTVGGSGAAAAVVQNLNPISGGNGTGAGITIDTTGSLLFDLKAECSATSASNTWQIKGGSLELIG